MAHYFAQVENGTVQRVIVANNIEWCQSRLGGEWIETRDPYAEVQADPELEPVNYCGPGHGADPIFPERFAPQWVQPAPDPETGIWSSYPKGHVAAWDGGLIKSTVDGNVWHPDVTGWHPFPEIEGVRPLWVQPLGGHDTWGLDVEVEKDGKYYRSTIPDNATIPGDPSSGPPWNYWIEIDVDGNPIEPEPGVTEWAPGEQVWAANAASHPTEPGTNAATVRSYQGTDYECRQSHVTQAGWEPPNVPALWLPL